MNSITSVSTGWQHSSNVSTRVFFFNFQSKIYKIKFLELRCVEVGENGFYTEGSEGAFPTTSLSKNLAVV